MKAIFFILFSFALFAQKLVFMSEYDDKKHISSVGESGIIRNITKNDKWHLYPDISKDGRYLVYVEGVESSLKIVLKDLYLDSTKVISNEGFNLHPKFSNRAKTIFYSTNKKIAYYDVNSKKTKFIDEEMDSFFPVPFQNAEMLVYQRNSNQKEIVLFDIVNNKKEVIGNGMSPTLSMDEKYIAYTNKKNGNWDIVVYNRFSKKSIRVTRDLSKDFSPVFDKKNNLYFTSDRYEKGFFSILKIDENHWQNKKFKHSVVIQKKKKSFYAPRFSGDENYKLSLKADMIGESRSSFGAISHKGYVYVSGGHQGAEHTYPPESFTNRVTRYNIKANKWENISPKVNRAHGFQIIAEGDYIYSFGGFAYDKNNYPKWKSISDVERYDIKNNRWEVIGHMPRRRSSNVVAKIGDLVYVIGGWDATPKSHGDLDGTFHREIDVFNLKTYKWSTLKTLLPKKRRAFSSFVKDSKIYLVGGISEGGSHFSLLDEFTEFDPKLSQFRELPKLPFATFAPAAGKLNNKAMIFGGMFKTGKWNYEYVPHIYEFNFIKNSWENTGRFLNEYKGFSSVVELGKCLGVLGGHSYKNNEDKPVNTFEEVCVK